MSKYRGAVVIECECGWCKAGRIGEGVYACGRCGRIYMTATTKAHRLERGLSVPSTQDLPAAV